jgi:hypothetical protein
VVGSAAVVPAVADEVGVAEPLGSAGVVRAADDDARPDDVVAPAEEDAEPVGDAEAADDDAVGSPATIPLSSRTVWTCCCTAWTWART